MNWMGRAIKWARNTRRFWVWADTSSSVSYRKSAGDLSLSSIVVPCVRWIQRTLPEAPLTVYKYVTIDGKEIKQKVRSHRLQKLFEKPNDFYSGLLLLSATSADYVVSGNAYWLLTRDEDGRVASIWWIPSTMLEPAWPQDDPTVFISHYEYNVDGAVYDVRVEDVIHFRNGFDPRNMRKGLSDLAGLIREIATDQEASQWTVSLLANMGVPGVIISPSEGAEIDPDDADKMKTEYVQNFTGSNRGKPMVVSGPVEVKQVSLTPSQMNLKDTRRIPEERVTAAIGTPAVTVGLGAGLERSTFTNMAEAREAAYESCMIPMQRVLAADINMQLVPNFSTSDELVVDFDLELVRVLQEDMNRLHQRVREDVKSGIISLNEGRQKIGEKPREKDVWYLTRNVLVVDMPESAIVEVQDSAAQPALPAGNPGPVNDDKEKKLRMLPAVSR